MYQLRPLAQSKKGNDYIIEKVPKHDLEEPPTALTYFYFHDTVNHFSSLGLLRKNAEKIKEGLRYNQKIHIKQNGDMRIKGKVYSGAFKPFFEFATKKPDPINAPKNEGEGVYIIPTDFQTEKNINELRQKISDSLRKSCINVPADDPNRLRKIASLQKDFLNLEGIEIETPFED
jgi:hypothetical protein